MVLFKRGNDFVKPDGTVASDVEVLDFLESLETETELSSAVEALTAGLAAGVSEELENTKEDLENTKEDLEALILATGGTDYLSALNAIKDTRKNLERQDGYILDLITMTGAEDQDSAKLAFGKAVAEADTVPELEAYWTGEISRLKEALEAANARIAELEKPSDANTDPETATEETKATTTKKGK